ncbi:MAG: hypothetical protein FDZ69_07545 [Deltaproteobacteria bacterium]|nr:MAG: hypothetical protein FDZ69_07545 [Deltaproteobacteria bacterium]
MSVYRIHPQSGFNFGELVIDNFAGGGGASTGIEAALGRTTNIGVMVQAAMRRSPRGQSLGVSIGLANGRSSAAGSPGVERQRIERVARQHHPVSSSV